MVFTKLPSHEKNTVERMTLKGDQSQLHNDKRADGLTSVTQKKACGVCFFVLEEMLRIFFAIFLGVMMSNGHLYLAGGLKHFLCSPLPGKMIQFDEHIFQMGWFNHQLVIVVFDAVFSLLSLLGPTANRPPQPAGDLERHQSRKHLKLSGWNLRRLGLEAERSDRCRFCFAVDACGEILEDLAFWEF